MHEPVLTDSHSCFSALTEPVHDDTVIWRYMSAQRLCELIEDGHLSLSSLTTLRSMDDECEGCLPEGQRDAVRQELPFALSAFDRIANVYARWIFVSCWTEVVDESPKHWGSYGCEVAIASTVGRLRKATTVARQCQHLISRVNYVSQSNYLLSDTNGGVLLGPALWKRKEFEWEQEIRLVAVAELPDPNFPDACINTFAPPRVRIPLDPSELVHEVRVSRRVPSDQFQDISKVVANICSADVPVTYARVLTA